MSLRFFALASNLQLVLAIGTLQHGMAGRSPKGCAVGA